MEDKVTQFISEMDSRLGASDDLLIEVQRKLGVSFPTEYVNLMRTSNGTEGWVGASPLVLWPLEDIVTRNERLQVNEYAPGLVLFGGDGAGMAYGFDTRSDPMAIVAVDYVSIGEDEDTIVCGHSFIEFLEFLYSQEDNRDDESGE